jgi:hypothetical protein
MAAAGRCNRHLRPEPRLRAAAGCKPASKITGSTTDLFSGFNLDRVAAAPALLMSLNPRIGLKMKGGCGGRGIYRIKPLTSDVTFRLQTASTEACQPLEEWASR